MKPRTTLAVQFALWAFFFGRLIPFSGDFLLPVIWIYDRRVFATYVLTHTIDVARYLPGAIAVIPLERFREVPAWEVTWIMPLALGMIAGTLLFETWVGAWWLRRKLRKKAPDLFRVLG